MIQKIQNEYLEEVLKKMCEMVNADYTSFDFNKPFWFQKHAWTIETEDEFREWFVKYLWKNKKAREFFMNFPCRNKEKLILTAKEFVFQYGWKYE